MGDLQYLESHPIREREYHYNQCGIRLDYELASRAEENAAGPKDLVLERLTHRLGCVIIHNSE